MRHLSHWHFTFVKSPKLPMTKGKTSVDSVMVSPRSSLISQDEEAELSKRLELKNIPAGENKDILMKKSLVLLFLAVVAVGWVVGQEVVIEPDLFTGVEGSVLTQSEQEGTEGQGAIAGAVIGGVTSGVAEVIIQVVSTGSVSDPGKVAQAAIGGAIGGAIGNYGTSITKVVEVANAIGVVSTTKKVIDGANVGKAVVGGVVGGVVAGAGGTTTTTTSTTTSYSSSGRSTTTTTTSTSTKSWWPW